jgi:hypothetical protein
VPDNSGAIDLGALPPEDQEAVDQLAAGHEGEPEKRKVLTAFAIVIGFDGNPSVLSYEHDDFEAQTDPTMDLVFAACSTVIKDIQGQEFAAAAAQATHQLMMQQARAAMEQQQAAKIAQQVNLSRPHG